MAFHSSHLHYNLLLLLFLGICNKEMVRAHQCYVCGMDEELNCSKFDARNEIFIQDCPAGKSCSLQTHGGSVTARSCENARLQDCQTANDILYCYCSKSLCNLDIHQSFSDDEDLAEGSGNAVIRKSNPVETHGGGSGAQPRSTLDWYTYLLLVLLFGN